MDNRIHVDLFTDRVYSWMEDYDIKEVSGPNGVYFTVLIDFSQKKRLLKKANRKGIKYRWYEEKWSRSSNYRDAFFKYYQPPYRCRYCNKKLKAKKMVIDHIVPVGQAKKSPGARRLLTIRGIQNVNDPRNLAPACVKCNLRKSDKMGFWVIRGIFGKYKFFWILYYTVVATLILFAIYSLHYTGALEILKNLVK